MPQPRAGFFSARALARKEAHPTALMQTGLWGLGRVIAEEHPDCGRAVDPDPNMTPIQKAAA